MRRARASALPDWAPAKEARCGSHANGVYLVQFELGGFRVPVCEQHLHVLGDSGNAQRLAQSWCMDALYEELATAA